MVQIIFGLRPFIFIVCASCAPSALIQRRRHQLQNESVESVESVDYRDLCMLTRRCRQSRACHQRDPLKMRSAIPWRLGLGKSATISGLRLVPPSGGIGRTGRSLSPPRRINTARATSMSIWDQLLVLGSGHSIENALSDGTKDTFLTQTLWDLSRCAMCIYSDVALTWRWDSSQSSLSSHVGVALAKTHWDWSKTSLSSHVNVAPICLENLMCLEI